MPRKPASLQYGVDETPPLAVILLTALQSIAVLTGFLVFPVIVTRAAHAPPEVVGSVLSWSLIVLAVGTSLQALAKGPVGSGYLAPSTMTAVYIGPSLDAVRLGGLALVSGMTLFGGVVEAALSRSMHRLRSFLPPELAGVVIVLVAIGNAMLGYRYLLLPRVHEAADPKHWLVAGVTLAVTVALSIWGRGILRTSCVLTGMIVGYAVAAAVGIVSDDQLLAVMNLPLLQLPRVGYFGWSFAPVLMAPFLIAAVANTLKAVALITAAERQADADWVRSDPRRIAGGVLADGMVTGLSGVCCAFATNVSASSIGLNEATGVASRIVAFPISGIFLLLALIPGVMQLFAMIPAAVVGATFIFTSCAVLKSGFETIASRMLDARRTLVVGLSLLTGIAVEAFPDIFRHLPRDLEPVLGSSLVLGTCVGFGLNAMFRIGVRRRAELRIDPGHIDFAAIQTFMEARGGLWGARRDVITRAAFAAQQMVEVIAENCEPRGAIGLSGSFDEFDLAVEARYTGIVLELPDRRPSEVAIRESEDGVRLLAGFILRHTADRASSVRRGENCVVRLQFHH